MDSGTDTPAAQSASPGLWAKVKRELREWGATIAIVAPVFLLFTGLIYEQRVIPSESMVPSLEVSDRVAVAKFAYGYGRYSFPLSIGRYLPLGDGRFFPGTPERGQVVVFEHPHSERVMIKRVIGLPGDRVQLRQEQLYINDEPVQSDFVRSVRYRPHASDRTVSAQEWRETIGGRSWLTHRGLGGQPVPDTPLYIVPEGHLFLMGDNRSNSLDSREDDPRYSSHCPAVNGVVDRTGCPLRVSKDNATIGFVPLDHLIGRADTVLLSFHRCKLEDDEPCKSRVWRGL